MLPSRVQLSNQDILNQSLIDAARYRRFSSCQKLILQGADPLHRDEYQSTCLHYAAFANNVEMIEYFYKLISDGNIDLVEQSGYTPLHFAAMHDRLEAAKKLLELKANVNALSKNLETPLHLAATSNSKKVFAFLLLQGNAHLWLKNSDNLTAFDCAVHERNNIIIQTAIDYAKNDLVKIDRDNNTHLHFFAETNHVPAIHALLAAKADCTASNNLGETCLHFAAQGFNLDLVKLLIENGADPSVINELGETAAGIANKTLGGYHIASYLNSLTVANKKQNTIAARSGLFSSAVQVKMSYTFTDLLEINKEIIIQQESQQLTQLQMIGMAIANEINQCKFHDKYAIRKLEQKKSTLVTILNSQERNGFLNKILSNEKVFKNILLLNEIHILSECLPELKLKGEDELSRVIANIRHSATFDVAVQRINIVSNILFFVTNSHDAISDKMTSFLKAIIKDNDQLNKLVKCAHAQIFRKLTVLYSNEPYQYELDGSIKVSKIKWSELDPEDEIPEKNLTLGKQNP